VILWSQSSKAGSCKKAAAQFDGHLEAAPRAAGSFRDRCRVVGLNQLPVELGETQPVVVTIDLDYFADTPANRRAGEFERVWKFVTGCRNLRAVTIALSRPYLKNDEEANDLLRLALKASLSLPTAAIEFEPFAKVGNDRSLRAREFQKRDEEVPALNLANASEELRALLLANRERISVRTETTAWERQLSEWEQQAPTVRLALKDREPSTDQIWRVQSEDPAEIELITTPWDAPVQRVEWLALIPEFTRCNLTAERADEIGFASGAPPRPRWREVKLRVEGRTLPLDVARRATATEAFGATRWKARVHMDGHVRETPVMEVRRFAGSGFRAAIREQFGLPYLFGSGELQAAGDSGPETRFGADCANFVVYALRRQGRPVPWSNPKQLRKYLEQRGEQVRPGDAAISDDELGAGLIVHLGNHVAAVMEDRAPFGVLDRNDLVAHQLEGVPETVSLGRLLAARKKERFDLFRVPSGSGRADLIVGGDVMLGRTVGAEIERGADPLTGIRTQLDRVPTRLVNLECILSDKGNAVPGNRYSLRAPLEAMRVLTEARISAVSLANNHATDFGREALLDSIARLRANEVSAIGAGETAEVAYAPHFFTTASGTTAAVIALNDVRKAADGGLIGSAADRERVGAALTQARARATFLLAFVHWGDENTVKVNERQRELARWLIDHGADAIVGTHPHSVQPFDSYHGRPIVYSLGNLVFDGAPTLPNWNRGQLVEMDLGTVGARQPSFRLVPLKLDARGFPQVVNEPDATKERRFTNRPRKDNGGL
jgi:capsule synthesis protein PGA_cap